MHVEHPSLASSATRREATQSEGAKLVRILYRSEWVALRRRRQKTPLIDGRNWKKGKMQCYQLSSYAQFCVN